MYNKGKCSSLTYVRSENPVYRWGYLIKSISPRIRKFKNMARMGVPQSDWLSQGVSSQPFIAIAPPKGNCNAQ